MNLAPGNVTALAAAQPGWTVTVEWADGKHPDEEHQVVAWASTTMDSDKNGLCGTRMEAVFFHAEYNHVYTESGYRSDMGIAATIDVGLSFTINPPTP
ncbi:hypothetical protein [Streptomyces sp. PvR018]|uniref:hypothetical protein n=1 Tax=Streptomyces sp. PvR018 TaxID=3156442 RepID=UPI0033935FC3